jgi:MFS-type transporter involved in bile tolerance (Atg22 family)
MIQRIQSIWLLLSAICAFVAYSLVLYIGKLVDGTERKFVLGDHFLLLIVIFAIGVLSLICIFLFKNRKFQYRMTILAMLLTIGYIFLQYFMIEQFKKDNAVQTGSYQVAALLPIAMVIFLVLAARGIRKDQKLIKSLDRLR